VTYLLILCNGGDKVATSGAITQPRFLSSQNTISVYRLPQRSADHVLYGPVQQVQVEVISQFRGIKCLQKDRYTAYVKHNLSHINFVIDYRKIAHGTKDVMQANTSLHFTLFYFLMISTPLLLSLIYHFPNPFSKTAWFAGESP
jgi:hypothetical protein